jgi:RNA polymerase sigma factor (sigma-70 family)
VLAAFERQAVVEALRRLPRRQREAVVLRYYGNFALDDMARMTGVSVGTAKSNLSRGRDALAKVLEDHVGTEGLE